MHLSRRSFLQGLATGSALLQYGCRASEPAELRARVMTRDSALNDLPLPDPLVHVLKRTRFGITQADFDHATQIGITAYLDEQLQTPSQQDPAETQAQLKYPAAYQSSTAVLPPEYSAQQMRNDLRGKTMYLALYSQRQLFEVLVDFWGNHFNIPNDVADLAIYKPADDREVIRAHALGNFRDLLHASAKSPAMLKYLDNVSNTAIGPNENYARELLELHTLGHGGGYTETDVKEVARCFTGWGLDDSFKTFRFIAERHDANEKIVLGQIIPAGGGVEDGERVLDLLAAHPSTARFIALKLVRRFVADTPPEDFVSRVAAAFFEYGGAIPALVRTLILDPDFVSHADEKIHRPMEFVAAAVRALAPDPRGYYGPDPLVSVSGMGHAPHGWQPPDGYPDNAGYWLSATGLLGRWNFSALLSEARFISSSHVQAHIGTEQTASGLVDLLAQRLVRRPLRADDRDALIQVAGEGDPARVMTGAALQDRAELIAGLLLASPYFVLR